MKYVSNLFITVGLASLLFGCGGGSDGDSYPAATSYSGKTTPATLTTTNAKPLSGTSTEAGKAAEDSDIFTLSLYKTGSSSNTDIDSIVRKTAETAVSYASEEIPGICSSGSVVVSGIDAADEADPTNVDVTIQYNSCTIADVTPSIKVNGTARFQGDIVFGDSFTITYTNFSIVTPDESETFNLTISCEFDSCTITTDFEGDDGRIYRVVDLTVSGYNPYTIEGRVYDPDHGYIDITTLTQVTFSGCPKGNPSLGVIQFTDGSNTVTVSYDDCDSYTVTHDDGATVTADTYFW